MGFSNFVRECREKEVFKMLSIYIVTSWVLIQVLAVIQEPLGLPTKSVSVLLIALLIGFPIYILYIWKIRLAPLELEKSLVGKKGKRKRSKFEATYFSALAVIALASGLAATVVFQNNFGAQQAAEQELAYNANPNKVAVLNFHNNTGDKELDVVGPMAADWILHGITENRMGQVVTHDVIENYVQLLEQSRGSADEIAVIKEVIKPGKAVRGSYYTNGDQLVMQASVMTGDLEETLISLPAVECDRANPLDCIEAAKQGILGYLATEGMKAESLEEVPPSFKAYQYLLEAKVKYDTDVYRDLLLSSIAEDPDYFEPKVLLVADYYNEGEYNKADSLNRLISTQTGITSRQLNLLNSYDALIKGDNRRVYARMGEEYDRAPWEIFTNTSMMVLSLQFVNRPEDVADYYSKVDMSLFDLANCRECVNRLIIKTDADLELGKYSEVVGVLDSTRIQIGNRRLDQNLLTALIYMGDSARSSNLLQEIRISNESDWKISGLRAAQTYLMMEDRESAVAILAEIGPALDDEEHKLKGQVSFLLQDYSAAAMHYQQALEADSTDYELKAEYAISLFRSGKQSEAVQLIQTLESDRKPYQYGSVDYTYAQFYAGVDDVELAFAYLKKSIAAGNFFLRSTYGNDLLFKPLKGDPRFEEILTYWH